MNRGIAFVELEQKIDQLVGRYGKVKEENSVLKREVSFLRQENQKLKDEQTEMDNKVATILRRVEIQEEEDNKLVADNLANVEYEADAARYENTSE